jgi:hypothetical protein
MLAVASCTKGIKSTISGDYMIIGQAGGFVGPAATSKYYLINNGQLKEDTTVLNTQPPADITGFHFTFTLPASKYDRVKSLLTSVPSELLSRNGEHIGRLFPDAGYTDVRTSINGKTYRWYFEGDQSINSTVVQQFYDSVQVIFQ